MLDQCETISVREESSLRWTPKTGQVDKVGQPSEVQNGTNKEAFERGREGASFDRGSKERKDLERDSQGAPGSPESGVRVEEDANWSSSGAI